MAVRSVCGASCASSAEPSAACRANRLLTHNQPPCWLKRLLTKAPRRQLERSSPTISTRLTYPQPISRSDVPHRTVSGNSFGSAAAGPADCPPCRAEAADRRPGRRYRHHLDRPARRQGLVARSSSPKSSTTYAAIPTGTHSLPLTARVQCPAPQGGCPAPLQPRLLLHAAGRRPRGRRTGPARLAS
jgi:hypothetical protein